MVGGKKKTEYEKCDGDVKKSHGEVGGEEIKNCRLKNTTGQRVERNQGSNWLSPANRGHTMNRKNLGSLTKRGGGVPRFRGDKKRTAKRKRKKPPRAKTEGNWVVFHQIQPYREGMHIGKRTQKTER